MSSPRLFWVTCLLGVLSFTGCANISRAKVTSVKRVYIENTKLTTSPTIDMLTPAVLESAAVELTRRGYVVVSSKGLAEGVLRVTWQMEVATTNYPIDTPMSLSMTLFNKRGQRIFSGNSGSAVPAAFWNQSRAASETASILSPMPTAVAATN